VLFNMNKSNTGAVLNDLVRKLNVKVNKRTINKCLVDHPEYPSLLAVSNCLTEWKINNQSFKANKNSYREDILFPFIAHLPENDGHFILVNSSEGGIIYYSDESDQNGSMSEKDFITRWDGITLYAEASAESGELNYKQNKIQSILNDLLFPAGIFVLICALYLGFEIQVFNTSILLLGIAKLAGVSVSLLLLIQSLNSSNPFVKNLCSLVGKSDCNAVLNSAAAKITPWLSWSEVGFFYFAGSFLSLMLFPQSVSLLIWLNILAIPYTFYSIGYQFKTKNWCFLCCTVQVLLWVEFLISAFTTGFLFPVFTVDLVLALAFSFGFFIFGWAFLKPYFLKANQSDTLVKQLNIFKYNFDIFDQALKSQPRFAVGKELMPIILGDPEAKTIITMVSSPFCGPCAKAHQVMDDLLRYNEDIQVKIVFSTANHPNDPNTEIAKHLSSLSRLQDKTIVEHALNKWYKAANKDYKVWASNFPVVIDGAADVVTQNQKEWCEMADITVTPTILINGYKLPSIYHLEDIRYLLN